MQQIDRVLVFDIWGDYAHFKRIETTTSPLTYSIPTGTSLVGIISAILGHQKDSYYELFSPENIKLAVKVLRPLKKIRININLVKTDEGFYLWDIRNTPRAPTPFEFLKEPKYRLYVWFKEKKLQNRLKTLLQNHWSVYTPYFGLSELIANFKFIGEFDVELESSGVIEAHSVIRNDKSKLIVEEGKRYVKETIPLYMDNNRVVQEYADVFFESDGRPLKVRDAIVYKIGNENVVFL
jgi:CRISPR-associated protein Cas5h